MSGGQFDHGGAVRPAGVRVSTERNATLVILSGSGDRHSLCHADRQALAAAFDRYALDLRYYCTIVVGAGEGVFCPGSDMAELAGLAAESPDKALASYALDLRNAWALDRMGKPDIPFIDGLVTGSGHALSLLGTHRVAGEHYAFAMHGVREGLFPQLASAYVLGRLPDGIGAYLALTGRSLGRADALALDLVTHCIPAGRFAEARARLVEADPVDQVLDVLNVDPGPRELDPHRETIARCFSAETVGEILERLGRVSGADAAWAAGVASEIASAPPTSLVLALELVTRRRVATLHEALLLDYRIASWRLASADFRAAAAGSRRWKPASLGEVMPDSVLEAFLPPATGDLVLPSSPDPPSIS